MWVCSTRLTKCIRIFWLVWFPRKLILIWKCNQISSVVAYQAYNCQYNLNKKKCKLQKPIELCKFERIKLVICYLQFAVPRMRHMCVRAVLVIRIFDWNAYCGECCECVCVFSWFVYVERVVINSDTYSLNMPVFPIDNSTHARFWMFTNLFFDSCVLCICKLNTELWLNANCRYWLGSRKNFYANFCMRLLREREREKKTIRQNQVRH